MQPDEQPDHPLESWVAATAPRALAYARTLIRDQTEAEDLVHDCYSRLLSKVDQYDLPADGTPLLF